MDIVVKFVLSAPHAISELRYAGCDLFCVPSVGDTLEVKNASAAAAASTLLRVTDRRFSYYEDDAVIEIFAEPK